MTALYWPVDNDFPQEILLENGETLSNSKEQTEMEVGPMHARLRDTVNYSTWNCQILLKTDVQRDMFKQFWQVDTKNGTIPFVWHDPVTEEERSFLIDSVSPLSTMGNHKHIAAFVMVEVPE